MVRIVYVIIALGLIVATGFLYGRVTNRWSDSQELKAAAERLKKLSPTFGDWESKEIGLDPRHMQVAEIDGGLSRAYFNKKTGDRLSVLLICGKPGPIAVHTPDICYEGAGYKMGTKSHHAFAGTETSRGPQFWTARFTKEPQPAPLHIMWAWSTGGMWVAPDNPRLAFYQSGFLYKLYIVHEAKSLDSPVVDETIVAFLKDFYPVLQQCITQSAEQPKQ